MPASHNHATRSTETAPVTRAYEAAIGGQARHCSGAGGQSVRVRSSSRARTRHRSQPRARCGTPSRAPVRVRVSGWLRRLERVQGSRAARWRRLDRGPVSGTHSLARSRCAHGSLWHARGAVGTASRGGHARACRGERERVREARAGQGRGARASAEARRIGASRSGSKPSRDSHR